MDLRTAWLRTSWSQKTEGRKMWSFFTKTIKIPAPPITSINGTRFILYNLQRFGSVLLPHKWLVESALMWDNGPIKDKPHRTRSTFIVFCSPVLIHFSGRSWEINTVSSPRGLVYSEGKRNPSVLMVFLHQVLNAGLSHSNTIFCYLLLYIYIYYIYILFYIYI